MAWYGTDLVPESPEWWAAKLYGAINDRSRGAGYSLDKLNNKREARPALTLLDAWMRNEPPLPRQYTGAWVEQWTRFLRASRSNYAELVVSSVSDRLVPLGWRTAVDEDAEGDSEAQRIAVETDLVLQAGDAVEDMLWSGSGYLLVGRQGDDVSITREDPLCTYVARSTSGKEQAGLRVVVDEWTGQEEHWLYLPGMVMVARQNDPAGRYEFVNEQALPNGAFPLVELTNRRGVGEFERHLDVLTRINDTLFTRLVLTKLQAHRQRAIEKDLPKDADREVEYDLNPDDFVSGPDALWDLPPGARIWESASADLNAIRAMALDDVKTLCAITGTPLADMIPDAANQSAKGTEATQEKHFARVADRQRRADRALAQVLALAFDITGDTERADASRISTIWSPIQRYSITEKAQAASQLKGIWPFERIATDVMQAQPAELPELSRMRTEDAMLYGDTPQQ